MKCPRCDTLLNELTKAGVLVDFCDRCHGLWLDRGELEKIARRLRELERDWEDDRGRDRGPDWGREDDEARRYPKKKRWTEMFELFD